MFIKKKLIIINVLIKRLIYLTNKKHIIRIITNENII